MKINEIVIEAVKQRLDTKCWKGKHKEGTKIKGGVRVNNCVPNESIEEGKVKPSAKYLKLAQALEDYANENISHEEPGFGDFMYHAELIRKGHPDIHKQDFNTVQQRYRKIMGDMIKQHLDETRISEGLTYKDPVAKWISVFKASTHPKFKDKTAEQREKMARMAQYKAVQNKKPLSEVAGKETIYDILEPENCRPFDGGCVLVAQALQKIHGGDIVVLINDRGNADHAAVKIGNTLIDYDGALPIDQFIKQFEKNEHVNIKGIRPLESDDLPDATRDQSLLPRIVDLLSQQHSTTLSESKKRKAKTLIDGMIKSLIKQGRTHDEAVADLKKQVDSKFYEAIDMLSSDEILEETLRDWFKQKWVRFGPDGKIRGSCARGSSGEGKPKCLPQSKAYTLGKKGRAKAAGRKRREDPNPERQGKAKNVRTKESVLEDIKLPPAAVRSIQTHLNSEYDANLDVDGVLGPLTVASISKFMPDAIKASAPDPSKNTAVQGMQTKTELDEKCWDGYKKQGMKTMYGKRVPNCVKTEDIEQKRCPVCGGHMVSEHELDEKQDACYYKVKSRYKVWPSAYASGALVQCRKKGAKNWGNSKTEETLSEIFDNPYKSKWEQSDYGDVDVLARLPDGTYLNIMFNHEGHDEWQVEFYRENSQAVTGQGDAQRIFATVLNAVQKFVKKHKPQLVRFSAIREVEPWQSTQSRAKLYDKLVQRYAHAWGYEAYQEDHGDQVTYELTRLDTDLAENTADGLISGEEMLDIFKRMHHEHGFNKQMERWIASQTWSLDTIEPEQLQDMYNDDEDTDPFERTVWLDDAAVTKYERILSAGQLVNPIIMGPGRAVIDGNHRAQAAKNLHVSIPGYVPVKNDIAENFADGKGPGRPGDSRRHGIPKHATLAQLDKIAHQGGRKGQLAHWQANMRRGRAKTHEGIEESVEKTSLSFPDGDIYIGETHLFDRKNQHGIGLRTIVHMLAYAARYHGDEIAALGPENFVIKNNAGIGIGVAKVLQPDDVTYKYIVRTIHPTLRIGHGQTVIRLGRSRQQHNITNEAIAPHGDSWNELNLMKIGEKPAALVGPQEFEKLYKPVMRKYNWIWTHVTVPNSDSGPLLVGFERYIIGQPGEQARIARMHHLLVQMNKNLKNGIKPDIEYHTEMGRLLGYSDTDIAEFLEKINL